ncbi:hypothetical protein KR100_07080 [Synechococcus sp. KORDI-100]|nr:hypothetical protein KR100_07080 [Synechococcus sp. KORDI-100]
MVVDLVVATSTRGQTKVREFRIGTEEQTWIPLDEDNVYEWDYQSMRGMIEYH